MCLASIGVGLNKDVYLRLMVSVDIMYVAMQLVLLVHTPQIHIHKFTVNHMIPTLSGGELLATDVHQMSMLCQLSTHSNKRCISSNIKWLTKVRQHQNWSCH